MEYTQILITRDQRFNRARGVRFRLQDGTLVLVNIKRGIKVYDVSARRRSRSNLPRSRFHATGKRARFERTAAAARSDAEQIILQLADFII